MRDSTAAMRMLRRGLAPRLPGVEARWGAVPTDQVDISDFARLMSEMESPSAARLERLLRLRDEIEAGTYETPERIRGTVESLMEEVDS